jgi:hypothetical protein
VKRLRPYVPAVLIAACAVVLASTFAAAVLHHAPEMGLPLEDAYIYLTYAKQFGRAEPFTYFSGGGYSAGSTSVLWPMLIAPFWTLGARGHALVWVSFGLCTVLFAGTLIACYRLAREMLGAFAGLAAAALTIAIAPFAWTSLAGMEVAFAALLLVLTILLLARAPHVGPPSRRLGLVLAATSLSRPEATLIVFGIVAVAVLGRLRQRDLRAAAWWAVPLVPPLLWVIANKVFAGNFFPNTGVAKSHFYLPGFDWTYWWDTVVTQTKRMLAALWWDGTSPFIWPRLLGVLWVIGALRVMWWAKQQSRWLVGALVVLAPLVLLLGVVASSGAWAFHNYRYIAAAFPLFMVTAACALAPVPIPRVPARWLNAVWAVALVGFVALFWRAARPAMSADIQLYAQNAVDLDRHVVTIGRYVRDKLPADASIMFHDAGAIAYYGDKPVYDMLGLVTNRQAHVANHGPGSRFEFLESLPEQRRPTHFAYYPGWMGQAEFFGEVLLRTPLGRQFAKRRLIGDYDMQLIVATWDHAHTAERPLESHDGWRLVDRVDVADLVSERAHAWQGALGRRKFGDPTARWSLVFKETAARGLRVDGGRTVRGGRERFAIAIEPDRPVRLVLRTGGTHAQAWHETISRPVRATIGTSAGRVEQTIPVPAGRFVELAFDLPVPPGARRVTVEVTADGPYRSYHWFALQPE